MAGWSDQVELLVQWGSRGHATAQDAQWDLTAWDDPIRFWSDTEPDWHDLTGCELANLTVTRGRSWAVDNYGVGTAQVSLVLTEDETGGPVPADRWSWRSEMTIGDELRIWARRRDRAEYWGLIRGDIRSLNDHWSPYGVHLLDIAVSELAGRLGRIDPFEREAQGAGEHSGARMHRIADVAGIPRSRREFDTGVMTMQATNLARNLAGEAEVTATSEGGDLYTDRWGNLTFRQRAWWQTDFLAAHTQFTWANTDVPANPDPEAGPGVACPVTVATRLSLELITNQVNLARAGGTQQTAQDSASIAVYDLQTFTRNDLMNDNDPAVASLAAWRVAETGSRLRLIDGIEVDPLGDPAAWEGILDAGELGLNHRLVWDDGETVTDIPVHVQGVTHTITPLTWKASLRVWDRYGFTPAAGWDIDDWDTAVWADPLALMEV